MKAKKLVSLLLAGALVGATVVGCSSGSSSSSSSSGSSSSGSSSSGSPTEITVWHAMSATNGEAVDHLVELFNDSQDEYHVTAEYQGTYDDSKTKFGAALQSGDVPDVLQMYEVGTQYMIDLDCYVPIQDLMDEYGYSENILPAITNYYSYGGKWLSMPFNTSTPVLWLNATVCEEAGLDVSNPPKTFDEILDWSKQIVDGGYCDYGFAAAVYGWFFEQMIAGQGLNYGNNDNGRSARMTEVEFKENGALKKILDTWTGWMDSGYCSSYGTTTSDTQTAFKAGQVAMIIESSGCLGAFLTDCDFEVVNAYFPKVEENPDGGVIIGGASMWIIDSGDENREKGAYEFLKFCSEPEQQAYWSQTTGYVPVNADTIETESFSAFAEETPQALTAFNQLIDNPVNTATQGCLTGVSTEARVIFENNIESLINHQETVDEAVDAVTDGINDIIEQYNANNG